jgi:transposase-like protein
VGVWSYCVVSEAAWPGGVETVVCFGLIKMECPLCKSTSYYEDDNGYFNCNVCGAQSQELFSESFETENCEKLVFL